MKNSFLVPILEEIAHDLNIKVIQFSDSTPGGYLVLPNGSKHYFKSSRWDINPSGGSHIMNHKTLTLQCLKKYGYSIPNGVVIQTLDLELFRDLKLPIVIKPNSSYQARGLTYVEDSNNIEKAFSLALNFDSVVRVEEVVKGTHLSFGVFNDKVYSVYEKEPFSAGNIVSDYTNSLPENVLTYISKIPELFNLKLASIDCVYIGNDNFSTPENFVIIEVNSAPSFRKYGESSAIGLANIKNMYTDILQFILNKNI